MEGHDTATSEAHQANCCDICGDEGVRDAIVTCIGCGAHEHLYCMSVVKYEYPETWYCEYCKKKNEEISPNPDKTVQIAKEPAANLHRKFPNDSRQIGMNLKNKIISGKTKFLSAEEVIGLTSGAKTSVSPVKVVHSSPVTRKKSTTAVNFKDIPSTSSKILVKPNPPLAPPPLQHLKPPMAQPVPLSSKQSRGTLVNAIPLKDVIVDRNQPTSTNHDQESKDIHQTPCKEQRVKEQPKDVQGDPVEIKLEKEKCVREVGAASVMHCQEIVISDSGTFHDLEIERTTTSVNSFVDPSSEASWNGIFKVPTASEIGDISDEIQAHPPCRVRKKVYKLSMGMPEVLQFELVPRMDLWEDMSKHLYLDKRDIGLYLFPSDTERWEQYLKLLKHMEAKDLVMRTILDSFELLVFPSTLLSTDCQEWNRRYFLWGVFKKIKPCQAIPINALEYSDMNNGEEDMLIDMEGGIEIETTGIVVANELFHSTTPDMTEDMEIDQIGGEAVGKMDIVIPKEFTNISKVVPIPDIPPGFENMRKRM